MSRHSFVLRRSAAGVLGLAALALAWTAPAKAGSLQALREALKGVADASPLRAELAIEVSRQQKDQSLRKGQATVTLAEDRGGLQIGFAADVLARAEREQAQTDPDHPRPVSEGLRSIDPVEIEPLLGYARRLLTDLDGATLLGDHAAILQGQPARLLEFELPVRLSESGRKRIKHARSTMKLWLGPDGLPLALEEQAEFKGRIFLIIGFEAHQSRKLQFGRAGDRLVVLRQETHSSGSGLGESASETRITTLKVL